MTAFLTDKTSAGLAPMAGCSDSAMRLAAARHGAAFTVSEMVSAKALAMGDKKSAQLMRFRSGERPYGIQFFGNDPECFKTAVSKGAELAPDFIDINMGCPAPKIAGNGSGSALMRDIELAGRIISAAVSASGGIPITVKLRAGFSDITCVDFARCAEGCGASVVTLHPRTHDEMFHGHSDWGLIKSVKQAVSIPVIGNGDIKCGADAADMLAFTGCDGIMVGRAALGNPFIFSEIAAALGGQGYTPPSLDERLAALYDQILDMCAQKGELRAMPEARKHVMWAISGFPFAASFRARASVLQSLSELRALIAEIEKNSKGEE